MLVRIVEQMLVAGQVMLWDLDAAQYVGREWLTKADQQQASCTLNLITMFDCKLISKVLVCASNSKQKDAIHA